MKNKYYTPDLEEFHIGFEYEFLEHHGSPDEQWVVKKLQVINDYENDPYLGDTLVALEHYDNIFLRNAWRVKYLNIEDLESLGWKCLTEFPNGFNAGLFLKGKYRAAISFDTKSIDIVDTTRIDHNTLFQGYIKNKSEFKRLMKLLNI